ncbi:MAG: hypothetical protein K2X81_07720 [Candidatus Obscuribacterales bacterium]|nr:hypothetical protein [Candidatus Obscuribacterales bacterium]
MSATTKQYFIEFAAAFVRGRLSSDANCTAEQKKLISIPLEELSSNQLEELIELGKTRELKLHKFKRTMGLARVNSVIGILRS